MYDDQVQRLDKHLKNTPNGFTSVYAGLKNGRRTEVDYISGYVSRTAKEHGIDTPYTNMLIDVIHAMESKNN